MNRKERDILINKILANLGVCIIGYIFLWIFFSASSGTSAGAVVAWKSTFVLQGLGTILAILMGTLIFAGLKKEKASLICIIGAFICLAIALIAVIARAIVLLQANFTPLMQITRLSRLAEIAALVGTLVFGLFIARLFLALKRSTLPLMFALIGVIIACSSLAIEITTRKSIIALTMLLSVYLVLTTSHFIYRIFSRQRAISSAAKGKKR